MRVADRRFVNFVIDLSKAGFVDSQGLEVLLAARRRCEEMSGQLKLANVGDNCRKILQLTRLEHRFECHTDLHAVLKTMS